jgi:hypothetical protein
MDFIAQADQGDVVECARFFEKNKVQSIGFRLPNIPGLG